MRFLLQPAQGGQPVEPFVMGCLACDELSGVENWDFIVL